jgi:hypothetical protein
MGSDPRNMPISLYSLFKITRFLTLESNSRQVTIILSGLQGKKPELFIKAGHILLNC